MRLALAVTFASLALAQTGCPRSSGGGASVTAEPEASAVRSAPQPSASPAPPPSAAASAVAPVASAPTGVAALFAPLFENGRVFKLRVTTTVTQLDVEPIPKKVRDASCTVAEVASLPWGATSTIHCEGLGDDEDAQIPLFGRWAATSKGLYRLHGGIDGPASLGDDMLILPTSPKPSVVKKADKDMPEGFGSKVEIKKKGDAWCHHGYSYGGDDGWSSICLSPKIGMVSGSFGWAGGSTHENEIVAVP